MEITFWGVRGAIPAPGPEFNRYGGNTPCVSIRSRGHALVILDSGTGITVLGRALLRQEFGKGQGEATVLLTHAHWDHSQGFPFFAPVYVPGNRFAIYGPSESPAMVEGILEGQMDPHFSPVHSLRNLGAEIQFRATPKNMPLKVYDLTVSCGSNPHGRSAALAYRIEEGPSSSPALDSAQPQGPTSVVYAPDVGYAELPGEEIQALYRGATYLIHDCTYTPEDLEARSSRGNASIAVAARVAARCRVGTLVMFHYDQDYVDDQVDSLTRRCRKLLDNEPGGKDVKLVAAYEGLTLTGDVAA
jgi:phosphoribosyl 1,2-cyclic phosphodiesterase